jgi:hypothetical protein
MCIMKTSLKLLTFVLAFTAFAPANYAWAAGDKVSEARAVAIRKCSVLAFRSAKEYNSSNIPWYTYTTCMADRGQRP